MQARFAVEVKYDIWCIVIGGKVQCWRQRSANKFTPQYVTQSVAKPQDVMVWACIIGHGEIQLRRCPQKVKAADYVSILQSAKSFIKPRCFGPILVNFIGTSPTDPPSTVFNKMEHPYIERD